MPSPETFQREEDRIALHKVTPKSLLFPLLIWAGTSWELDDHGVVSVRHVSDPHEGDLGAMCLGQEPEIRDKTAPPLINRGLNIHHLEDQGVTGLNVQIVENG
jgi:hypothetical protein